MFFTVKRTLERCLRLVEIFLQLGRVRISQSDIAIAISRHLVWVSLCDLLYHFVLNVADHVVENRSFLNPTCMQAFEYFLLERLVEATLHGDDRRLVARVGLGQGYRKFEAGKPSELQLLVFDIFLDEYFAFKVRHNAEVQQLHDIAELISRTFSHLLLQIEFLEFLLVQDRLE